MKVDYGLYFITDRGLSLAGDIQDVRSALEAGVKIVQYREKILSTCEIIETAAKLRRLCGKHGALFLVNDRVDVALSVGADGVHLGQDDMPITLARKILGDDAVIGVTVHNVSEARAAGQAGADYLGVSPIYATDTKKDAGNPGGIGLMRDVKAAAQIPCVGIGGINEENMLDVFNAGADGVCMVSAIVAKKDVAGTVKRMLDKIHLEGK